MKTKLEAMLKAYRDGERGPIEYHDLANLLVAEGDGRVYLDAVCSAAEHAVQQDALYPGYVTFKTAAPQVVADERKPFAFVIVDKDRNPEFVTPDWDSAQEHINDACEMSIENAGKWKAIPAFEMRPTDDKLWDETMKDRDQYHEWADKLSEAIALHFGGDIGEHSNMNCPWAEALEIIEQAVPVQIKEPFEDFKSSDWRIDTSAGRPILAYKDCSVIEDEQARYVLDLVRAALASAPVQAQEPVAYIWSVNGMVKTGGDPVFDGHEKFYTVPVQPVAVPDGWRDAALESAVQSVAERAGESETIASINAFDAIRSLKKNPHALPESCSSFAAPAAQGDALVESNLREIIAKTSDDYARYVAQTTLDAIAAKAAS